MTTLPADATFMSDPFAQRLIALRHEGASWEACAAELGRSVPALNIIARRLRDRGHWRLSNGSKARGAPRAGARGRPRNVTRSAAISPRFAPEVADAVRVVAESAGVRAGQVVAEAMQRALDRKQERSVSGTPLGLDPGESTDLLSNEVRTVTLAVNVPAPLYKAFVSAFVRRPNLRRKTVPPGAFRTPMAAVTDATHRLLVDLNYTLVKS